MVMMRAMVGDDDVMALPVRAACRVVVMTLWIPANSPHPVSEQVYAITGLSFGEGRYGVRA
jgi:hypothetical protein